MPKSRTLIPREGFFTLDAWVMILKRTLFNPTLTLPLYLALQYTDQGRAALATLSVRYPKFFARLKLLVALGAVGRVNSWLSRGALNNWKKDTFRPGSEIVVVTGGSSGIGLSTVKELVARGGIKAIVVLDVQELPEKLGSNVHFYRVDLSSAADIKTIAAQVKQEVGNPTVLINNAGICRGKTLLDTTERDLTLTFAVNVYAHFHLCQEFLPAMIKANHGHVITIASAAGYVQAPNMIDYSCSKAAAISFHDGLALELKHRYNARRVRTSLVTQSYVRTPLFEGFKESKFLTPALDPKTLAEAIVDRVWSQESGQVVLPRGMYQLGGLRGWPHWLQKAFLDRTRDMMNNWRGKQVIKE